VYQLDLWMMGEAHCRELQADEIGDLDLCLAPAAELLNSFTPCRLPESVAFESVNTKPLPQLLTSKLNIKA
jgi:cobyrinic acid a,c-diamide synthase